MTRWIALSAALCAGAAWGDSYPDAARIVSVGGSVTEIVYALGEEDRLVARDTTSTWPEAAEALPDVGYMRRLSAEGILSTAPDLILAEDGAGPPETVDLLAETGLPFVTVPDSTSAEGIVTKINAVAEALGVPDKGTALAEQVRADLTLAEARADGVESPRRVLFVLSMQGGRILASGTNTAADGIIALAGGVNAVTEYDGYKPLTDEAVIAAAPDVVLMMDRGDHALDADEVFGHPALAATPAGTARALVRMDGLYLLGFGPRTAAAAGDLNQMLYGGG